MQWSVLFFGLGLIGTWLARRYALHSNLWDEPGDRRSHRVATPRGGGMSIAAAMLVAAIAVAARDPLQRPLLSAFAAGLAMVAGIGMMDDHRPLSPWLRLGVHGVAAALLAFVASGGFDDVLLGVGVFIATITLTNIWNFMDGINGLAASQALIVAAAVMSLALPGSGLLIAAALAAVCAGFLPFNFPDARIFMGDVGSGAVGYAIAFLWLAFAQTPSGAWWLLLLPLSAFIIDAGLTLLQRVIQGERWWTAHTRHAYQACARRWGHTRVTVAYAAWTLVSTLLMWVLAARPATLTLYAISAWYMSGAVLWLQLGRVAEGTRKIVSDASPNKEKGSE